jgi:serine/threonine protein kinase
LHVLELIRCENKHPPEGFDAAFRLILENANCDLNVFLNDHPILSQLEIFQIAIGLAKGLCSLHAKKIVHTDVKPHNVFVSNLALLLFSDFELSCFTNHKEFLQRLET